MSTNFQHRVAAVDDDLHDVPADVPLWSESALITCHDPATGISVYGHLVLLGNEVWESIFSVYLPNGEILTDRSYSRHDPKDRRTGQMVIRPVVPLERWQLAFDGVARRVLMTDLARGPLGGGPVTRLEVDLDCVGTSPTWGRGMRTDPSTMSADDSNPAVSGSGLHLEQSLKVRGTVRFDNHTVELDAVGHRDHSCGPRARSNQWRVSWVNGSFPSGRTFHGLNVWVVGRPTYARGYVWDGTTMEDMTDFDGPALIGATGEPRDFEARFSVPSGDHVLKGQLLGSMPTTGYMPQGATVGAEATGHVAVDGPGRWEWDGEVGYGWVQRTWIRGGWDEVREADRPSVLASRRA
ncbi:hypothetical protein AB0M46_23005 [Dactylosporangium sp. NPDC051485]|uniref:DUF7064 domain-containing protein n=1 Tax=Dactylosporangium sp. NPDC051485 TaxID=3154846 RepID=UPI00343D0403